ncbi:unnamed protein product, partial [Mesorhabditis spiculigera]
MPKFSVATWLRREMDDATFIAHRRNSADGRVGSSKKVVVVANKERRFSSQQRQQHGHTVTGIQPKKQMPAVDAPPKYEDLAPRVGRPVKSTTCTIL